MADDKKPTLYIPGTINKTVDLECGVCGAGFSKSQMALYDRHVYACANSERAYEMEQHSPRVRYPFLKPDFGDVEFGEWLERNKRAVAEGRKKM